MTDTSQPTLRFAPSPTGYLHLGHAYSALLNMDIAKRLGGRLQLRIEDIDTGRARPAFVDAIIEDLSWLGVTWDGPIIRQSSRFDHYAAAEAKLDALGLLYRCGATRADITRTLAAGIESEILRDPDGAPLYKPVCTFDSATRMCSKTSGLMAKRIAMDRAIARATHNGQLRLSFQAWDGLTEPRGMAAKPDRWGDAVLVRKDVPASYHLASVVDDALQGVTHVVRGDDIAPSTDLHILLQTLLGLPSPVYHHHKIIMGDDGKKLSKSNGAPSIRQMRAEGATPETIRELAGVPPACDWVGSSAQ